MMLRGFTILLIATLLFAERNYASEPNESAAAATVLTPGVLSISDTLTVDIVDRPDTLLGIRNSFGDISIVDDDGSPVGDGTASGVKGAATHSGSIRFAVTGFGDDKFLGSHVEAGQYEVFVDVYDPLQEPIDSFSQPRSLEPSDVHEFTFSDPKWVNGSYDVYIDNTVEPPMSDVDFFTFTGLGPGKKYTARTLDPLDTGIGTYLGWFSSDGTRLAADHGGAGGNLSMIKGIIPADGMLTFAVTGFDDEDFTGNHMMAGAYELQIELKHSNLTGDYDGSGVVDAADYVIWRDTLNRTGSDLSADGDGNNQIDNDDYQLWKSHFGETAGGTALTATVLPEPAALAILAMAMSMIVDRRQARRRILAAQH